ncbi:MAG: GNAT family N-acetyltransferase [Lachnospiraceae bacterium]|nr:GNAT family N-acetyltransferase [Lachnospiraceae bacterium]
MIFEEKEIRLKDGRTCILRSVRREDAADMIEYLRTVSGETDFLLRNADEVTYTLEGEGDILENKRNAPGELMMVAEADGIVAGNCGIVSRGNLRRVRHRCGFAIALKQEYCDAGLGTAMMEYALSLAREMGYEQVELEVVDGNDRARHVYEKMGFRESGRVLWSLKYDDGSYRDEISMVKLFD